jgi:hypothetical protein
LDRPGKNRTAEITIGITRAARRIAWTAAFALVGSVACAGCLPAEFPGTARPTAALIGIELPLRGDIGADGLAALDGITNEVRRFNAESHVRQIGIVVKDTTLGGYANPHQDEGTDASGLPPQAASIVSGFAKDQDIIAAIGGLQSTLALADAADALAAKLPLVTLAPIPDDCAAARGRARARYFGAVSVAGAASLEALAVARVVTMRRYHALGIMSETDVKPRAAEALCFIDALAHQNSISPARIALSAQASDFPTLKRRASDSTLDGFVYFGPAERGALVCDRSGILALQPSSLTAAAHRGYDSATLPSSCRWLRRSDDPSRAARSAVKALIRALTVASRRYNGDVGKVTRRDTLDALRDSRANGASAGSVLRGCADGSADRATFETVPQHANLPASLVVEDRRCTTR